MINRCRTLIQFIITNLKSLYTYNEYLIMAINNIFGIMVEIFPALKFKNMLCYQNFFPCSRRVVFIAEQYKIPLFRSTMVVCGRRHATYVCFIHIKRTNPLSLWTLKKNKNAQNGMKNIWYIRALENVNLVSTIISMIYPIWLKSIFRFSINREWNIDRISSIIEW